MNWLVSCERHTHTFIARYCIQFRRAFFSGSSLFACQRRKHSLYNISLTPNSLNQQNNNKHRTHISRFVCMCVCAECFFLIFRVSNSRFVWFSRPSTNFVCIFHKNVLLLFSLPRTHTHAHVMRENFTIRHHQYKKHTHKRCGERKKPFNEPKVEIVSEQKRGVVWANPETGCERVDSLVLSLIIPECTIFSFTFSWIVFSGRIKMRVWYGTGGNTRAHRIFLDELYKAPVALSQSHASPVDCVDILRTGHNTKHNFTFHW